MYDLKIWQNFVNIGDLLCFFGVKFANLEYFFTYVFLSATGRHGQGQHLPITMGCRCANFREGGRAEYLEKNTHSTGEINC